MRRSKKDSRNTEKTHAVIINLYDVFSIPCYLMGYEDLLMAIAAEPELVSALVTMSVDVNNAMAKEVTARGVRMFYISDDFAGDRGSLMSPAHFCELFYPGLSRVMKGCRDLDLRVTKHSDGILWPLINMIMDSGIDYLDRIDRSLAWTSEK